MNNAEFCDEIGYGSGLKRELAEKVRDVTRSLCKLDPDSITPNTDTHYLSSKMFDGWDEAKFLTQLERVLDVPLDSIKLPNFTLERFFFLIKTPKPLNYGEWVKNVVELLAPTVAERFKQTGK